MDRLRHRRGPCLKPFLELFEVKKRENFSTSPSVFSEQFQGKKIFHDAEFYHTLIEAEKLIFGLRGNLGDGIFSKASMELAKNLTKKYGVRLTHNFGL